MNTYFKIIVPLSYSILLLNGCVSKTITITERVDKNVSVTSKSWGKIVKANSAKKEECLDCYATPLEIPEKVAVVTENSSNNIKYYGIYDYVEEEAPIEYLLAESNEINSAEGSYTLDDRIAIQVGAFRKYSGAKHYKRRYSLLSNDYKVSIKTVEKKHKPLYRVRVEGFATKFEAKEFMDRYGIRNAFLVRN